ncbi:MAG TPA: zinc ribbon domain-containing protein [Fimbriimonadaceae bacterium]|nr:zinc ribbon domain-containing protein [Fimbriimonadaceae bacterium]
MPFDDAVSGFLIAVACGVVLGIAVLLIIYKMVDGDIPFLAGFAALVMVMFSMVLAIKAPFPAVPGIVLVMALTLMALFPYAEQKLEEFELRGIEANQIARSYAAIQMRPDNFAAKIELAKQLYAHQFPIQGINLMESTLQGLSAQRDDVQNRSMRDVFYREDALLQRWKNTPTQTDAKSFVCPSCGNRNEPHEVFCTKCQRPYMLDIVRGQEVRPRVWGKLVLTWAAIALFIPGAVVIGMSVDGFLKILAFGGGLGIVGGLIAWLFKPPKHAVEFLSDL